MLNIFLIGFISLFLLSLHHVFANRKNRVLVFNKANGHHEIGIMDIFGNVKFYVYDGNNYLERLTFRKVKPNLKKKLQYLYQREQK